MRRLKNSFLLSCSVAILLVTLLLRRARTSAAKDYNYRIFSERNSSDDKYSLYSRIDEESLNMSIRFFLNYIDPCGNGNTTAHFSNFTMSRLDPCKEDRDGDDCKVYLHFNNMSFNEEPMSITNDVLSLKSNRQNLKKQSIFTKEDMMNSMARLSYYTDECVVTCRDGSVFARRTNCGFGATCDFEENSTCLWTFETTDSFDSKNASKNFRIIVGDKLTTGEIVGSGGNGKKNVVGHTMTPKSEHFAYFNSTRRQDHAALIVSPYYQYASSTCELSFTYRLYGIVGAAIIVTTQHREVDYAYDESTDPNHDDIVSDWTTPTVLKTVKAQSGYSAPWKTETVHVGQISFPTRIRIECHTGSQRASDLAIYKSRDLQNVECYIDDITLAKCDEELHDDTTCESFAVPKYLCTRSGRRKCINQDQLCDMQIDCAGGEDEDVMLHNCTQVPTGARCNFEETVTEENPAACAGWLMTTSAWRENGENSDKTPVLHVTNVSGALNFTDIAKSIPIKDHTYGSNNASGHFLFSPFPADKESRTFTYLTSPKFPPTSPALHDPTSDVFGSCRLQFFYCTYGAGTPGLQIDIVSTDGQGTRTIWTPTKESFERSYFCDWTKMSVEVPQQNSQYNIRIKATQLFHTSASFALDDLSLSPNCFLDHENWGDRMIPYVYNFTSCGQTENVEPNETVCSAHYNRTRSDVVANVQRGGYQTWVAPLTAEYRIDLFGASGGKTQHQKVNNNGGRLVAITKLNQGTVLNLVVGQKGASPCSQYKSGSQLSEKLSQSYAYTCDSKDLDNSLEVDAVDAIYLPGTGGGGASWVEVVDGRKRQVILIAGGGGGVFPGASEGVIPIGGLLIDRRRNVTVPTRSTSEWMSGMGSSIAGKAPHFFNCTQCAHMSGNQSVAGTCEAVNLFWKNVGGFGGGGASCGPGGGGGAGYIGGIGGSKTHGTGGYSFVDDDIAQFLVEAGESPSDGFILIYPCKLQCPGNATCKFKDPAKDGKVTQLCICPDGSDVSKDGICREAKRIKEYSFWHVEGKIIIVFVFLLAVFLIICSVICYMSQRKLKKWQVSQEAEQLRIERMNRGLLAGLMDEHDMNNPIYDLGRLQELNHIPRSCISLKCRLGQGAFGEVYEGVLLTSEAAVAVAVKTLHVSSNQQAFEDFETEALIMSKFRHENIVEFFGVSFDAIPRFLVLELLAGGDLKTFLRESRPKSTNTIEAKIQMIDLFEMALDVAKGCQFLEENRFIHRDLAARNCLLTHKEPGRKVKIADFGMARDIYKADYYRKGGKALLPVKWMPPEAFLDGLFTSKTDVWSYGVLMWEIFSLGFIPYPGRGNQEVMDMIMNGGRLDSPNGLPEEVYGIMVQCWNTDEGGRPGFTMIAKWLEQQLENPIVKCAPVPMILHKMGLTIKISDTKAHYPFMESLSTIPSSSASQATVSTLVNSTSSEMYQSIHYSMPTTGDGINFICEPYRSKCTEAQWLMQQAPQPLPLSREGSDHEDSDSATLENNSARSVSNYQNPGTPRTVRLDQQAPGSRQPILDQASTAQLLEFAASDSARQKLLSDSQIL
ncbi:hypothetical protein QR680_003495 [Steinernema hermaphroditum]|uniref:Tyrosine-protein kinase receptor n=1 Tax=Steinernema hermaphroditum TaxID=289476 RepID=A0AA39HKL0_9BILA|nr:hypothetical protein QR680_003495 [Steinernema hermaphroditum]